jgi:carbamoyl-phosphate synthase large subunit
MAEEHGVLVFPGGTEIGLEVRRALGDLKEVRLVGAGSRADRHGPFAYREWHTLPSVTEPGWVEALNALCEALDLGFVFPGHDDVVTALAQHAGELRARPVTSPARTCEVARSKRTTYRLLADVLPVPYVFDDPAEITAFPVFAKPDRSQGSQGAVLVGDATELAAALAAGSDLVMEYLPGREHTVDCFSDRERGVLFARGRQRERTRAGISMATRTEAQDPRFLEYARAIASRLELHGAWFFQLREDRDGQPRLLEVAPRVAGTSALHRVLGVNLPLLSLYEQLRAPVQVLPNEVGIRLDRALVNRYRHDLEYRHVYVDLDDTLIVRGEVNHRLVGYLYQCLNAGRRLVLITRHAEDVSATLARFRLTELWDEVIHVTDRAVEKTAHIPEPDAILIDDAFRERRVAREERGIATFDSSMLELLLDDRL